MCGKRTKRLEQRAGPFEAPLETPFEAQGKQGRWGTRRKRAEKGPYGLTSEDVSYIMGASVPMDRVRYRDSGRVHRNPETEDARIAHDTKI